MKKDEFLDRLCQALRFHTSADEIQRTVLFYSEAIDDRMEDGMTEEEAVSAMGSVEDIAREVRRSWESENDGEDRESAGFEPGPDSGGRVEPGPVRQIFEPSAVERIEISDTSGSLDIGPSGDGKLHVEYTATNDWKYNITGERTLKITRCRNINEEDKPRVNFELFGKRISIVKPMVSGILSQELGLRILLPLGHPIGICENAASGDVSCRDVELSDLTVRLASGDAQLENVTCGGRVSAVTASGDVTLDNVSAPALSAVTVSGDVSVDICRCGSLSLKTVSGDVDLSKSPVTESLAVSTVSGDLTLDLVLPCPRVSVDSVSGDVTLSLPGGSSLYNFIIKTQSGDRNLPSVIVPGPNQVRISTLSGDIDVYTAG